MLIVPEIIFLNTLKAILNIVRTDFKNNVDETKTIIYRIVNGSGAIEKYDLYTQLKKIICTNLDDPRSLDFALGFNLEKCAVPHIHITLPSESSGPNGLGIDQGFKEDCFDEESQTYKPIYTRRFQTTYQFIITSDNSTEVIAIYHFLRALDIALISHFELSHLEHIVISGGDVNNNSSLVPRNIFMRSISLSFAYEISVEDLFSTDYVTKLIFDMQPNTIADTEIDQSDSVSY
jgi:hypothetical protein